jgi:hypothetical protein
MKRLLDGVPGLVTPAAPEPPKENLPEAKPEDKKPDAKPADIKS